jgi:anti-sigma regulatory factor (Ser/Thr protein kinase)
MTGSDANITAMQEGSVVRVPAFDHPGLLYAGAEQYVAAVSAFVRDAVDAGDAVLVAVPEDNLRTLRRALADVAAQVRFADLRVAGRNPGRILPGVLLPFADRHAPRRVSIVGEPVWAGRTRTEYPACVVHEALINTAFAGRDAAVLCPYDTRRLDARALDDATRTHPVLTDAWSRWASPTYADPTGTAAQLNLPLSDPPGDADTVGYAHRGDLTDVRRVVAARAAAAGLPPDRIEDATLVVHELAANTLEHTGGPGRLAVWHLPGRLFCQVGDGGRLTDPLAGRVPPPPDAERGRGLITVNLLCDLVRTHTGPTGTTFRLELAADTY